jgi:hypothetical protein
MALTVRVAILWYVAAWLLWVVGGPRRLEDAMAMSAAVTLVPLAVVMWAGLIVCLPFWVRSWRNRSREDGGAA